MLKNHSFCVTYLRESITRVLLPSIVTMMGLPLLINKLGTLPKNDRNRDYYRPRRPELPAMLTSCACVLPL